MAAQLKALYEELGRAFSSRNCDLKKCTAVLAKLKVGIGVFWYRYHRNSFVVDWSHRGWPLTSARRRKPWRLGGGSCVLLQCSLKIDPFDIRATGDILEVGAFVSIRSRDVPSFDRYFSQLQTFYTDYRFVV